MVHGDTLKGCTRSWNHFEDYWPCDSGLSVANAIGTQLRNLINSGLARWRLTVKISERSRLSGLVGNLHTC